MRLPKAAEYQTLTGTAHNALRSSFSLITPRTCVQDGLLSFRISLLAVTFPPLTALQVTNQRKEGGSIDVYELRPMVSRGSELDAMRISDAVSSDGTLNIPKELADDTNAADAREKSALFSMKKVGNNTTGSLVRYTYERWKEVYEFARKSRASPPALVTAPTPADAYSHGVEISRLRQQVDMMQRQLIEVRRDAALRVELAVVRKELLAIVPTSNGSRPRSPTSTKDTNDAYDAEMMYVSPLRLNTPQATRTSALPAVLGEPSPLAQALRAQAPLTFNGEALPGTPVKRMEPTRPATARASGRPPSPRPAVAAAASKSALSKPMAWGGNISDSMTESVVTRLEQDARRLGL